MRKQYKLQDLLDYFDKHPELGTNLSLKAMDCVDLDIRRGHGHRKDQTGGSLQEVLMDCFTWTGDTDWSSIHTKLKV